MCKVAIRNMKGYWIHADDKGKINLLSLSSKSFEGSKISIANNMVKLVGIKFDKVFYTDYKGSKRPLQFKDIEEYISDMRAGDDGLVEVSIPCFFKEYIPFRFDFCIKMKINCKKFLVSINEAYFEIQKLKDDKRKFTFPVSDLKRVLFKFNGKFLIEKD